VIVGIGVDLAEVPRIRAAIERADTGERFRNRIYTEGERRYCERRKRKYESYAARFAAKEAVMKAVGRGWGRDARWHEIEVVRAPGGPPQIRLHGATAAYAEKLGIRSWKLAITHTAETAMAQVIAEGGDAL
jgi:holo-[acyl-carrier protein] synthase